MKAFGTVHILVNNAALYYDIDNFDTSYEYLQKVTAVNQHGAWLMTRAAAPVMAKQHYGRVINQSSGAAYAYMFPAFGDDFTGLGNYSYSITKWGIVGLTKFMAAQLGNWNITVNCIAPGVTMTEATKKIVPDMFIQGMTAMTAMKSTLEPEDLAGAVRVLRQRRRQVRHRPDAGRSTAASRCPPRPRLRPREDLAVEDGEPAVGVGGPACARRRPSSRELGVGGRADLDGLASAIADSVMRSAQSVAPPRAVFGRGVTPRRRAGRDVGEAGRVRPREEEAARVGLAVVGAGDRVGTSSSHASSCGVGRVPA